MATMFCAHVSVAANTCLEQNLPTPTTIYQILALPQSQATCNFSSAKPPLSRRMRWHK